MTAAGSLECYDPTRVGYYSQSPFTTIAMVVIVVQYNKRVVNYRKRPYAITTKTYDTRAQSRPPTYRDEPERPGAAVACKGRETVARVGLY